MADFLERVAGMPVAPAVDDAVRRSLAQLDLDIGGGMKLRGNFASRRIAGIAVERDGIRVDVVVEGRLAIETGRKAIRQAAAAGTAAIRRP